MTPYIKFIIPNFQLRLDLFDTKCEVDNWYFGLDALSQSIFLLRQSLLLKYMEGITTCRDNPSYQQFRNWLMSQSNQLSHQHDKYVSQRADLAHRFLDDQELTPGGPQSVSIIRSSVTDRVDLPGQLRSNRDLDIILHFIKGMDNTNSMSENERSKVFRMPSASLLAPGSTEHRIVVLNRFDEVPYDNMDPIADDDLDIRDWRLAFLCGFKHNMNLRNFLMLVGSLGVAPENTEVKRFGSDSYEFLLDYIQSQLPTVAKQTSFHLKNHYDMSDNFAADLVKSIIWKHRKHDMKLDLCDLELLSNILRITGRANQRSVSDALRLLKRHGIKCPGLEEFGQSAHPAEQLMHGQAAPPTQVGTLSLPLAVIATEAWFDDDDSDTEDKESEDPDEQEEKEEAEPEEGEGDEETKKEGEEEEEETEEKEEGEEEEEPETDDEDKKSDKEEENFEPSSAAERIAKLLGFEPKPVTIGSLQELIFRDLVSTHIKRLLDQKQTSLPPESVELLRQIRLRWLYTLDIDELMKIIENVLPSEMHPPR